MPGVAAVGVPTWAAAKAVKVRRRGRPVRGRRGQLGPTQAGLGYLSGHAAVAAGDQAR